jgi:hypothetical protein
LCYNNAVAGTAQLFDLDETLDEPNYALHHGGAGAENTTGACYPLFSLVLRCIAVGRYRNFSADCSIVSTPLLSSLLF